MSHLSRRIRRDGYEEGWVSGPMPGLAGWRRGLGGARGFPGIVRCMEGSGGGLKAWRRTQRPGRSCAGKSPGAVREGCAGPPDRAPFRDPGQGLAWRLQAGSWRKRRVRSPGLSWRVHACSVPMVVGRGSLIQRIIQVRSLNDPTGRVKSGDPPGGGHFFIHRSQHARGGPWTFPATGRVAARVKKAAQDVAGTLSGILVQPQGRVLDIQKQEWGDGLNPRNSIRARYAGRNEECLYTETKATGNYARCGQSIPRPPREGNGARKWLRRRSPLAGPSYWQAATDPVLNQRQISAGR